MKYFVKTEYTTPEIAPIPELIELILEWRGQNKLIYPAGKLQVGGLAVTNREFDTREEADAWAQAVNDLIQTLTTDISSVVVEEVAE